MVLELSRTEYNMKYNDVHAKAVLARNEDRGEVSLFIEDQLVYYHIIDDSEMLDMDEVEVSKLVTDKLAEDTGRWIRDCSIIIERRKDFEFVNKVAIYTCSVGLINFDLRLTSMNTKDNETLFKLEAFSDKNDDVLEFNIKAVDHEDLNNKLTKYAEAIVIVAAEFGVRRDELVNSTFARR